MSIERKLDTFLGWVPDRALMDWQDRADEYREALEDLVALRCEMWAIGGGPGWKDREKKAWDRAEELVRREE